MAKSTSRTDRGSRNARRSQRGWLRSGLLALAVVLAGIATWWAVERPGSSGGQALYQFNTPDFHSLAFDPSSADTLYFGHHQGLKVSRDGGETWSDTDLTGADAMALAIPGGGDRRYIAGHHVFVVSTDSGKSWQPQRNNLPDLDLHGFAASPSDPDRLYAYAAGIGGLFTSGDGGATWEARALPPGMAMGMLPLAVAPGDPLHVYAAAGAQVAESRDGGKSWQGQSGPPSAVSAVAAVPASPRVLYAGTEGGLWKRATDGGWLRLPVTPHGPVLAVAVSATQPERVAIVDGEGYFFRSDDGGQSWIRR